jgi:hypothetical protein
MTLERAFEVALAMDDRPCGHRAVAPRMRRRALGASVLTVLSWSCSEPPSPPSTPSPPSGPAVVFGRVLDFATGAGVAAIGIQFGPQPLVTAADGGFTVSLPVGDYTMRVDGEPFAALVLVRGPWTRGDFLAHAGTCASRYGAVTDHSTGRPIAGAAVGSGTSANDGWYRVDYGCNGCGSCGTAVLTVSASGYASRSFVLGRGVAYVQRLDVELDRQ